MPDLTAQRTLVKSPPELWSELSEVESLARHLGELGEIRITRVEPETAVAWEGEDVRGTVQLEQSGWGTKVTFRATVPEPDATVPEPGAKPEAARSEPEAVEPAPDPVEPDPVEPEPEAAAEEPEIVVEPEQPQRGFWTRWLFRERRPRAPEPEPAVAGPEPAAQEPEPPVAEPEVPVAEPVAEPEAGDIAVARVQAVLEGTLEALGQAHHRPFSRG